MARVLVVPGVSVEARFDVLPPPPAQSGILGAVGIVDRLPADPTNSGATKGAEVLQLFGPGTVATMPQVFHALANGVSEVAISPVEGGTTGSCDLLNANSVPVVRIRARAPGAWANALRIDVRTIDGATGPVRATLRVLRGTEEVEIFPDLIVDASQPMDLFSTINLRSRHVVALDPGFAGVVPEDGTFAFADPPVGIPIREAGAGGRALFQLLPADEADPVGLSTRVDASNTGQILVEVLQGGVQERFANLVLDPDSDEYLPYVLLTQSRLVRVQLLSSITQAAQRLPSTQNVPLAGGAAPSVRQYRDAIDLLSDNSRIDLVLACVDPGMTDAQVRQVHQALVAHAVTMADNGAPRIAFGSITARETDPNAVRDHSAAVRNRRFVLVAPSGAEGAVAGLVGRLNPQDSPTFKPCPLFDLEPAHYRESELNRLLGSTTNACVVQDRVGHGVVVLRGLDTSGDQISVTRVADQCIRETKAISENFIGELNSEDARIALREQIVATLTRMERAGALVKSTNGKDPAFTVDVYSTQLDFGQGIVRVDIAVRPVRAIDYVYATIRVRN
jgi:hypothetical protein